ncbi:MAG TPA: exopolysaccharide transport family protein, partial [Opitutaceae bacterium]|nr:exopolysaccharide transport family protein [Opitutaceae bacterium]
MTTETAKAKHPGAIDPWEVIYLFRDYLGHILLCVFITVGLAVLYLLYTRPVYSSRALLEISQQEKQNGGDIDSSDTLKTIELKIASQSVLLGVIKANKLADDPDFAPPRDAGPYSDSELVQRLASLVSVNLVRGSRLISVTAEDHSPEKAQRLAQAVINEFFKQSVDLRLKDSSSTREALLAEAKRLASEFTAAEEKLQSYREKFNTVSLTDKQNIVFERLKELNQQVANAKKTRMALESDYQRLKGYIDSDPEQLLNIRDLAALPEMVDLRKQVALQEAQVATLAQRYGPLHPTMVQSKSQLEELRKSLHNAIRKAGNLIMQSYDSAKSTEVALETSLSEQERASLELDRIAIPYHSLERQLESSSTMYQQILGRLKQTDLSQGLINANDINGAIIRVIEQPLVPMHPIRPSPKLVVAIAILGGLVIGCALALLSRAFDNTLTSVDEAESFLGLSVLTAIPRSSQDKLEGGAIVLTNPASAEAESFRSLRTSLSLLGKDEEKRSILFTSAISGEGKSYCSVNYATALAMQ